MTGKIKLVHSGGNSVSVAVPTNAPSASEVEFKLPQSDGSANQVLKTDGSGNLGWATDQGGKILQVVSSSTATQAYKSANTSWGDTGLTATITPASGTKILIIISQPVYVGTNNATQQSTMYIKTLRDSTQLQQFRFGRTVKSGNGWQELWGMFSFTYLDTHGANGSTAVTYKTQYKSTSGTEAYVQRQVGGVNQNTATINLLEVAT